MRARTDPISVRTTTQLLGFTPIHRNRAGFTLTELLVALMVSSVVLSAVAALTFAVTTANDSSNDVSQQQAQLRYTTLRITELVRNAKLVGGVTTSYVAVWAHDNGDDLGHGADNNQINAAELIFIEIYDDKIKFVTYSPRVWSSNWHENVTFTINEIRTGWAYIHLWIRCDRNEVEALPDCQNLTCSLDASPPLTKHVTLSFDLPNGPTMTNHQISSSVRCWAGHLLDASNELMSDDD